MKVIETVYKGYRFRSRLEARWAVFFDALGIEWEYEKEGFEFDDGTKYLPDFWLPEQECFVEIKGAHPNQRECGLAAQLAIESGYDVLIFWGGVGEYPDDSAWIYCHGETDGEVNAFWDNAHGWHKPWKGQSRRILKKLEWDVVFAEGNYIDSSGEAKIESAYAAARSARFEFGESGATL